MKKKSKSKIKAKAEPVAVVAATAPQTTEPLLAPEGMPSIDAFPPWRSPRDTGKYLQLSLPIIYRMIKAGDLESYTVAGGRRITTTSIRHHMLPPSQRGPAVKYTAPYKRINAPPNRWPKSKGAKKRTDRVAA